jgi:hypothetical protein
VKTESPSEEKVLATPQVVKGKVVTEGLDDVARVVIRKLEE